MIAAKRVLRYLQGTKDLGLVLLEFMIMSPKNTCCVSIVLFRFFPSCFRLGCAFIGIFLLCRGRDMKWPRAITRAGVTETVEVFGEVFCLPFGDTDVIELIFSLKIGWGKTLVLLLYIIILENNNIYVYIYISIVGHTRV